MKKAGEEEDWNKKTGDRGGWKRLADEAVKKLQAATKGKQEESESLNDIRQLVLTIVNFSCLLSVSKIYLLISTV